MTLFLQRGPRAQWDPAIAIVIIIAIVVVIAIAQAILAQV
jgi:preprotein translocase subunit Sec61beta